MGAAASRRGYTPRVGEHGVRGGDAREVRAFTQAILRDLDALEALMSAGMIEEGVRRVGLEQEMFLVHADGRPAAVGPAVLARAKDPRLTSELATFNLEANLPPVRLGGTFLRDLEEELRGVVNVVDRAAQESEARVLLTGILPTLQKSDLTLAQITPEPRYRQLNDALMSARGGRYGVYIRGLDELETTQDSVMFESANTSFQVHLQVGAAEFPWLYNLAQLLTAPLLAAAVGSPLLFGHRLWQETRVAVFERSADARSSAEQARGARGRVSFGDAWLSGSVLDMFREDAARHRVLLTRDFEEDPVGSVTAGRVPRLRALTLHNGTVWRWNRACYGTESGVAHLRIENRILPAGPTLLDEVANAALFWGMMLGLESEAQSVATRLPFDVAKQSFLTAARHGLDATLGWLDGRTVQARELLLEELIPAARRGLSGVGVPEEHLERYLGTIEQRVSTGRTAARWMLDSFAALRSGRSAASASTLITQALTERQRGAEAAHHWSVLDQAPPSDRARVPKLSDIMTTDLFTVRPEDVVDLATSVMTWKRIRHVPVETEDGQLVGLLSHRSLISALARAKPGDEPRAVRQLMDEVENPVDPDLDVLAAMTELLTSGASCLLVVSEGRLVGLVTERDLLRAASRLLRRGEQAT